MLRSLPGLATRRASLRKTLGVSRCMYRAPGELVEGDRRVARAGAHHRMEDLDGHRADVGPAMAADLGLVAHAAEGDAHELAVHRPRDGLRERGLADAGRADEAEDRPPGT